MSVRTQAGSSVRDHAWEASSGKNNRNGHQCASHFSIKASLKTRTLILKRSTKVLAHLVGTLHLMASLLSGAGLRLIDCSYRGKDFVAEVKQGEDIGVEVSFL